MGPRSQGLTLMLTKVISGAQVGVDRLGLDIAIALGIPHGGWCPARRRAEDGVIPSHYQLQETPLRAYWQRTEWNVRDSDATLLVYFKLPLSPGTALTLKLAKKHSKPLVEVYLPSRSGPVEPRIALGAAFKALDRGKPLTINVAGPRVIPEDRKKFAQRAIRDILLDLRREA